MNRTELNQRIAALLKLKKETRSAFTVADIEFIQQYEGKGGLQSQGVTDRGILYEYYTPVAIVQKMWGLVAKHGFKGGKILEPAVGTGRFLRFADPVTCTAVAYEWSKDDTMGFEIAKASFPWADIRNDYFESYFYEKNRRITPPSDFDLVIGNPPYGTFTGLYSGNKMEGKRTKAYTYDQYFIEKGIELLKPGGLLCMIVPSTFMANAGKYQDLKAYLYEISELLEAYRLPVGSFEHTQVGTDILIFRRK